MLNWIGLGRSLRFLGVFIFGDIELDFYVYWGGEGVAGSCSWILVLWAAIGVETYKSGSINRRGLAYPASDIYRSSLVKASHDI